MRKVLTVLLLLVLVLGACGAQADYTTEEFQDAVQNGEDVAGKTVLVEVEKVVENPVFGYIIEAGDHLHFANSKDPKVDKGDTIVVEVKDYTNFFGEFTVPYDFVE